MNNERLWTKDFVTVSFINFFIALIFYLLLVTIAPYTLSRFHTSTSIAGLVSGIFIIGALIGRLITGRIIDDIGNKNILILSLLIFAVTSALYLVEVNLPFLIMNRFLQGMAFGVATTTIATIIAQITPATRLGEGISYFSMSTILATAIGPFIGILLVGVGNFSIIFIFNIVLSIFCFVISFAVSKSASKSLSKQDNAKNSSENFKISNLIEFKAIPISIIILIISFTYSGVLTFISIYAKQIGLVESASFFFIVYAVTVLVSRPFLGRLFDARGANIVIYPCLLIYAMGMFLFSQATIGFILLLAGILLGLGYGNIQSSTQAIVVKIAPPNKLGLATATYFMFYDMGFGVGPYLFGFLIPSTGYRGLYLTMVMVILGTVLLYYLLHGRKEKQFNTC